MGFDIKEKKVKEFYKVDFELYKQGILEDIIVPYDEIHIFPTIDQTRLKKLIRLIYIKRLGGILVKDIAHIVFNLISYLDSPFYYEGLNYYGEYKDKHLYIMEIGT